MKTAAIQIIHSEHRSMFAVIHALEYLAERLGSRDATPDFRLLNAILYYVASIPSGSTTRPRTACCSRASAPARARRTISSQRSRASMRAASAIHALTTRSTARGGAPAPPGSRTRAHFRKRLLRPHAQGGGRAAALAERVLAWDDWERSTRRSRRIRTRNSDDTGDEFTAVPAHPELAPPPIGLGGG